jgi:alcohol dehydrogenase (NADP+)
MLIKAGLPFLPSQVSSRPSLLLITNTLRSTQSSLNTLPKLPYYPLSKNITTRNYTAPSSTMATDLKWEGWVGHDVKAVEGNMVWEEFKPKAWEETDVDIQVTHSAICGSDCHVMRNGWGHTKFPLVVGHEIVGRAVRVGSKASGDIKVGDLVGVGAQADSCLGRDGPCYECENKLEVYCNGLVETYNSTHRNGDKAQGGHATYHRACSHFVIKIPENLAPEYAAPMLCGGVTVYSPLMHWKAGPGKRVAILGLGGLGHFGVLFAKALGCDEVVGISRKAEKKDQALQLGCDDYIATDDDKEWSTKWAKHFDLIISTASGSDMPWPQYFSLLRMNGTLVQVGAPETPLTMHPFVLFRQRLSFAGSCAGGPDEIRDMLQLAADKQIKPWVETRPMAEANQALVDQGAGKARFRYVLTQ